MLNGLDLFSGFGGLTLALSPWVRPIAYCENDRYAQSVLLCRMADGEIPIAPIWDDIRTLSARDLPPIDILYGGFPCQDISSAGTRAGLEGERSGLFFQAVRLVRECRPKLVYIENVAGIKKFVPTIRAELEGLGFKCRDGFIPAPPISGFEGFRWFLLAAAESVLGEEWLGVYSKHDQNESPGEVSRQSLEAHYENLPPAWDSTFGKIGRDVDGLPNRVDRIKSLGNAVVPLQAREAFKRLSGVA